MIIIKVLGAALAAGYARWRAETTRARALAELRALRSVEPALMRDIGIEHGDLERYVDAGMKPAVRPRGKPRLKLVVDNPQPCCAA